PPHPVRHHEQVLLRVDEKAVLVAFALAAHIGEGLVGDLHASGDEVDTETRGQATGRAAPRDPPAVFKACGAGARAGRPGRGTEARPAPRPARPPPPSPWGPRAPAGARPPPPCGRGA